MRKGLLLKGAGALLLLWALVLGVSEWAAERKATADRVAIMINEANISDWQDDLADGDRQTRREKLDRIAKVFNRLDLRQRELLHEKRTGAELFDSLGPEEKLYFLDKTLTQSMRRMMEAFDKMGRDERRDMVARSIRDLREGPGGEDFERLQEEDPELLDRIVKQGFATYYQDADADTKMDLIPLMDAFGEVIQGFSKPSHSL